jgi:8-hydroxy-5-deazaflavin:NADPH oxidoreductase
MTTVGIIGAGHIGSQFARLAVGNGHNVFIGDSRGPETLSAVIAELGPKAHAATAVEAAKAGDIVVVSVIVGVDHDFARQGLDLDLPVVL